MKTYGFDYTFAISWAKINEALARNQAGKQIDLGFRGTDPNSGTAVTINITPKPWFITDGGGNSLLNLQIDIAGGYLELEGPVVNGSWDLTGLSLIVQVSLSWVGDPTPSSSAAGSGGNTKLAFQPSQASDKTAAGYVSLVNVLDPQHTLSGIASQLLGDYAVQALLSNRDKLSYIFADVMPAGASPSSWLKPAAWMYFNIATKGGPNALCFLCQLSNKAFPAAGASFDSSALDASQDAVILISQEVLFQQAVLPAVTKSFPGASFSCSCSDEICTITNNGGFSVGKVQASSYSLKVDSAGTGLAITSSGGGPLKFFFGIGSLPDASYSWSTSSNNPLAFSKGVVSFTPDPSPDIQHDQTMHWYDWALIVFTGITNIAGLASDIYDAVKNYGDDSENMGVGNINSALSSAVGGNFLNLGALIDWNLAGKALQLSSAGLQGPLFVRGSFV